MACGIPLIEFHPIGFVHNLRTDHEICFVRLHNGSHPNFGRTCSEGMAQLCNAPAASLAIGLTTADHIRVSWSVQGSMLLLRHPGLGYYSFTATASSHAARWRSPYSPALPGAFATAAHC